MKTIIYLFVSLLSQTLTYSQITEFAPIGAKWWYRVDQESPELYPVYIVYEVESDTIIDGIEAVKISSHDFYVNGSNIYTGYEYFKKDTSEIAVYRNGSFHTFLNFNALEGDTVTVLDESFNGFFEFSDETFYKFKYIIDSIDIELIDGNNLKVFYVHVSDDSDYWFGDFSPVQKIIKYIGAAQELSLLGYPTYLGFAGAAPRGLYCYETNDLKLSINGGNCDSLVTNLQTQVGISTNFLILNTSTTLTIKPLIETEYMVRLYDISGSLIFKKTSWNESQLDISNLSSGVYIVDILAFNKNQRFTGTYLLNP